ncbi:hypothetical protein [Gordonia sp. (in: high G+C Gram-positive bacteria)]|uniref:hypothetical protein n=1 Tax=Gordonia sp. (in: high G+C Gram-positive bacteria) TaxID=84139 RepID=UPI003C7947F7
MQEALSRIYSWEPVRDVNSGAGMTRALPWLSGEMRSVAEREDVGNSAMRPMKEWDAWRQEKAIIGATVKVVPQLDDADSSSVTREATVLQEVQRADGSVDPLSLVTYEVDVARDKDECWRVWRVTVLHHQPLSDGVIQ